LKSAQTKLKALVAFVQIVVNVDSNCNIVFPEVTARFFDKLGIFNLDIVPSLGLNCRFSSFDYVNRMIVVTIVPLLVSLLLAVAYFINSCFCDCKWLNKLKNGAHDTGNQQIRSDAELKKIYGPHSEQDVNVNKSNQSSSVWKFPHCRQSSKQHSRRATLNILLEEDLVMYRRVFYYIDKDVGGTIDRNELRAAFKEFKPNESDELEIETMLNGFFDEAMDEKTNDNNASVITFERFALVFARSRKERKGLPDFVSFINQVQARLNYSSNQTIVYLFLLLTFIVLTSTSSTVLHCFKACS